MRALRRRADLSQRELAARSGVPPATVGSVECGTSTNPGFQTVARLVAATGARLAIVDIDGSEPVRLGIDRRRDRAARQLPAHLDPYRVTWVGARRVDRFGFIRNRRLRDAIRREQSGSRRETLTYEVRRLGPGDATVLAAIRADARQLDPAGRPASEAAPLPDEAVLRYLRNPDLRHWIAEERSVADDRQRGQVLGQLVAHVQHRPADPPIMTVVQAGARPEHRGGLVGITLVAAMSEEAALLGVDRIVAVPDDPAVARFLYGLGFRRQPRRPPLLTLGG